MNLGPEGIFSLRLARCSNQPVLLKKGDTREVGLFSSVVREVRCQNLKVTNVTKVSQISARLHIH